MTGVDAMLQRRRRARTRWLATAAIVAAACAALVVALSGSSEPESPAETVQQYVDAIASEDYAAAWDLTWESEQRKSGSEEEFTADQSEPRLVPPGRRIATEAVPFEPFPIEAWRVGHYRRGAAGANLQELVIRENGHLRVCGDPRYLYEMRAGIA